KLSAQIRRVFPNDDPSEDATTSSSGRSQGQYSQRRHASLAAYHLQLTRSRTESGIRLDQSCHNTRSTTAVMQPPSPVPALWAPIFLARRPILCQHSYHLTVGGMGSQLVERLVRKKI